MPNASRTDTCGKMEGRTDRRMDMTQVIGISRDYVNAPRHNKHCYQANL